MFLCQYFNLEKPISFDDVKVTVGECPNIGCGLCDGALLPEQVSKHVSLVLNGRKQMDEINEEYIYIVKVCKQMLNLHQNILNSFYSVSG